MQFFIGKLQIKKGVMVYIIPIVIFSIIFPGAVFATHGDFPSEPGSLASTNLTGEDVCNEGDELEERTGTTQSGNPGGPGDGGGGGLYVPVKDFEAEQTLHSIAQNINAIAQNINSIEEDSQLMEQDTQSIRYYMRVLCEKEYVHDHTIQHAWAKVIGEFVEETRNFTNRSLNGNPIFITNQFVYNELVKLQTLRTLLLELQVSNIDKIANREIAQALIAEAFATPFPYFGIKILAKQEDINKLAHDFDTEGSYSAREENILDPSDTTLGLLSIVREELGRRMSAQTEYENQKLDWGRGFFSLEECDLKIFSDLKEDRRNCRIVTPGSLIQDEVSFVFGSALRQMELNDEYEEWIAPNTLAALNDILGDRGFNSRDETGSRGKFNNNPVTQEPEGPDTILTTVKITQPTDPKIDRVVDIPREFSIVIDDDFYDDGSYGFGNLDVLEEYLNPDEILNQYPDEEDN